MPTATAVSTRQTPSALAAPSAARNWTPFFTLVAVLAVLAANVVRVPADPDLWGHLLFGLTSIEQGQLARVDPYSYTAGGGEWINHEWLTEWTFGAVYSTLSANGLVGLRALLLSITVAAIGTIMVRRKVPAGALLAVAVFGISVLSQLYRIRPQMFTYTLMALLLLICDGHRPGKRWGLCLVPPLVWLWTNLHAGFVAGLGIFGVHWLSFVWEAWQTPHRARELRFLAGVMLAALAATALNPYGPGYWRFVLYAVTLPRPEILEWRPIPAQNVTVILCYLTAVLVPAYVWFRSRRSGHWAETATFALGAVLAGQHARHLPFLFLFAAVLLARRLPELLEFHGERWFGQRERSAPLGFLVFLLLVVGMTVGGVTKTVREVHAGPQEGWLVVDGNDYPVRAVDFLVQNRIAGNLDCGFNWGEYCIFKLYPQCRVFCDGRYETVYPHEVSALALGENAGPREWERRLNGFGTELILAPLDDKFADWAAEQGDFVEIYADTTARVLARRSEQNAELLQRWQTGRLRSPEKLKGRHAFPA